MNGYKSKVRNREPIITRCGVEQTPPQDQYFKGALFLNTLRSVVDNDKRWWTLVRGFYDRFKYRNIRTADVVAFFNRETGMDLTPIFDQYLRHADLPTLELEFDQEGGAVSYRWKAHEPGFAMPVKVGRRDGWRLVVPTPGWQSMKTGIGKDEFEVATDLYYINVTKR